MATAITPVNVSNPAAILEPPRTSINVKTWFEKRLIDRATELLESHPHFRGRRQWVYCRCSEDKLLLLGAVPTYYLKQLAQEAIRELGEARQIVNRIKVVGPYSCFDPECETINPIRKPR